jgi:mRNA interferase RelE/StbE
MPPARRDLRRLSSADAIRVVRAIDRFAETERGDVRKLQGYEPPQWRLRVGQYRVRFVFLHATQTIEVLHVLPRGRAYRD